MPDLPRLYDAHGKPYRESPLAEMVRDGVRDLGDVW